MQKEVVTTQSLDYKKADKVVRSVFLSTGKRLVIYFGVLFIVLAFNVLSDFINGSENHYNESSEGNSGSWTELLISLTPFVIFVILISYFLFRIRSKNTQKQLVKKSRYFTNVTYTVNNSFFKKHGEGFENIYYWDEIDKVKETSQFYLIFSEKFQAHVIEKEQLDPWQAEEIREIFKELGDTVKISLK